MAFMLIALASHDEGITAGGVLRVAVPILAVGLVAGLVFGTYRRPLFLSLKTVEWNLSRIYRKLGIRSRTELARWLGARERPAP